MVYWNGTEFLDRLIDFASLDFTGLKEKESSLHLAERGGTLTRRNRYLSCPTPSQSPQQKPTTTP